MTVTFIALGTMGWIPSERRESACFALVRDKRLLLFDCGTGARRLGDPELAPLFDPVEECFIFLSHYHLDHTMGIIYLPKLLAGRKVTIAGPGADICGISTRDALERLTSFPLFSLPISEYPMDMNILDLHEGVNDFPGFRLAAVKQQHTAPSLGMRLDDLLAYATDTVCSGQTVELARNVPLLVHECWLDEEDYQEALSQENARVLREHSWVGGVADIAVQARVELLALTHLNPNYREGRLRRMEQAAREIFPESVILQDYQEFSFDEE